MSFSYLGWSTSPKESLSKTVDNECHLAGGFRHQVSLYVCQDEEQGLHLRQVVELEPGEGDGADLGQEGEEDQLGSHPLVLALYLHLLPLELEGDQSVSDGHSRYISSCGVLSIM